MEKTIKPPQDQPLPEENLPQTFKQLKELLEQQSTALDQSMKRSNPQSVDAKFNYLFQAVALMGTVLHRSLEILSERHEVNIQIIPSINPGANRP